MGGAHIQLNNMEVTNIITEQKKICEKYNAYYFESPPDLKIGVSKNLFDGTMPINALRHSPKNDTAGWYIFGRKASE